MIDWLFFSCIASFVIALGLGVVLFVNWRLDRAAAWFSGEADSEEAERAVRHSECPWNLKL